MTTQGYLNFEPNTADVDPDFQACINKAQGTISYGGLNKGINTFTRMDEWIACDHLVGSIWQGGMCNYPAYMQTNLCSCVNVNVPGIFPFCAFSPCQNGGGYVPSSQYSVYSSKSCPSTISCTQLIEMGGENNVASNLTQSMNCGGTVVNPVIPRQTIMMVLIFVVIVTIVYMMLSNDDDGDESINEDEGINEDESIDNDSNTAVAKK